MWHFKEDLGPTLLASRIPQYHRVAHVPSVHSRGPFTSVFGTCWLALRNGGGIAVAFVHGVLAVTMMCNACWSSASARRDEARHCLFLGISLRRPLTTGSKTVGVDRMHADTSRRLLFRAASLLFIC